MTESDTTAEPGRSVVGGVRATWWNAVLSLVAAVLAAHAPIVVFLVAGARAEGVLVEPIAPRVALLCLLGAVSVGSQLAMVPWLRPGLGAGVSSVPVAVSAVGTGLAQWGMLPQIGVGVLPLVSAISLLACACGKPVRRAGFAGAVAVAILAWALADLDRFASAVPTLPLLTLCYPYLVFASVWAWDVVTRLNRARAVEADLAVARERLRFAADLHDIQGHSLQVIALKSELAERLLGARPDAAAVQISEVRVEAADALARTRELARGYRATSIDDELDNARDVLTVAGFECGTEVDELPRDSAVRSLLGRALREATTNVLRHAEPGPVRIGLGREPAGPGGDAEWCLRVVNRVSAPTGSEVVVVPDGGSDGAGLAGLAARARRLGGRVEATYDDDGDATRFVLTVAVPVGAGQAVRS